MNSNEQYPVRVEQFHAVAVNIYEIDGKDYLTAEDIGRCLGLAEPAIAVNKIYRRNREELESHKAEVKDATLVYPSSGKDGRGGGPQATRLFTETGANLIGMFSRTAKSKDFRLWLARLPRRVRELVPEATRNLRAEGVKRGFAIASDLLTGKVDRDELLCLWWWRRRHATQKEVALLLDLSRDQVQVMEKRLVELGMEFPKVNANQRLRLMKEAFAEAIAGLGNEQIPPSPPLLKGGEEAGHGTSAG